MGIPEGTVKSLLFRARKRLAASADAVGIYEGTQQGEAMQMRTASLRRASEDQEWPAQHPAPRCGARDAIRAPAADARFDREVWAHIRAHAAAGSSASSVQRQRQFGAPFWLNALNAIAIGVVVVMVALALGTAAQPARVAVARRALAELDAHGLTHGERTSLWLGLRRRRARTIGLRNGTYS